MFRISRPGELCKMLLWKISQNSKKTICVEDFCQKETTAQVFSSEFSKVFQNKSFKEQVQTVAFVCWEVLMMIKIFMKTSEFKSFWAELQTMGCRYATVSKKTPSRVFYPKNFKYFLKHLQATSSGYSYILRRIGNSWILQSWQKLMEKSIKILLFIRENFCSRQILFSYFDILGLSTARIFT